MSLVYGVSSIFYDIGDENFIFCGIGPYLRLYKNEFFFKEFLIFDLSFRISGIDKYGDIFLIYSENLLKMIKINDCYNKIDFIKEIEFPDWIVSLKIIDDENIYLVLRHGQFVLSSFDSIKQVVDFPEHKIAVSAIIERNFILIGDSFGYLSYFEPFTSKYFKSHLDKGSIFDIDIKDNTIFTVHEYFYVAFWELKSDEIALTNNYLEHSSRIWFGRCVNGIFVSFGEDGCAHLHDNTKRIFQLHRGKSVTAVCICQNVIITGGYDCKIRKIVIPDHQKNEKIDYDWDVSSFLYDENKLIIGLRSGELFEYPSMNCLIRTDSPIFLLVKLLDDIVAVSRNKELIFVKSKRIVSTDCQPVSLASFGSYFALVMTDKRICIYKNFEIVNEINLSEYVKVPPETISMKYNIIAIGTGGNRVIIVEFENDFSGLFKIFTQSISLSGVRNALIHGDAVYFSCASKSTVFMFTKRSDEWVFKTSFILPAKNILNSNVSGDRPLFCIQQSNCVSIFDLELYTVIATIYMERSSHYFYHFTEKEFKVFSFIKGKSSITSVNSIGVFNAGEPFHGLRGLISKSSENGVIVTGSCDQFIRTWKIVNGHLKCVDYVRANNAGIHSLYIENNKVYSGGVNQSVIEWDLIDGKLYMSKEIDVFKQILSSKCKRRVTSLLSRDKILYVGLSDATLIVVHNENLCNYKLNGVATSILCRNHEVIIPLTNGNIDILHDDSIRNVKLSNIGIHSMCSMGEKFYIGCDDGSICELDSNFNVTYTEKRHLGGTKSVSIYKDNIVSVSYDQSLFLDHCVNMSISHAESIVVIDNYAVVLGTGLQCFNLDNI